MQLLGLAKIPKRGALLQEQVQEELSFTEDDGILLVVSALLWNRWNVEAWEPLAQDVSEVEEDLESSLAVDLSFRVAPLNRICVVVTYRLLDEDGLSDRQLHESVVGRLVHGRICVTGSAAGGWLLLHLV